MDDNDNYDLEAEEQAAQREIGEAEAGIYHEILRADHIYEPKEFYVEEMFHVRSPYLRSGARLSYSLVRFADGNGNPTHFQEWWAPASLLSPDNLATASYYTDVDQALIEAGVPGGCATARESYGLFPTESWEAEVLKVAKDQRCMQVKKEFFDEREEPVLLFRNVIGRGHSVGLVRNLTMEKLKGGSWEW